MGEDGGTHSSGIRDNLYHGHRYDTIQDKTTSYDIVCCFISCHIIANPASSNLSLFAAEHNQLLRQNLSFVALVLQTAACLVACAVAEPAAYFLELLLDNCQTTKLLKPQTQLDRGTGA